MKVLITGGLGYIGARLTGLLQEIPAVEHLLLYDNFSRKHFGLLTSAKLNKQKIRLVEGDILDGRKLKQHVGEADLVIHLAAKVSTPFADGDAHAFEQVNHWGTAQLIDLIEETDVRHLLFLSSASVYGAPDTAVDEKSHPDPITYYGISKWNAEQEVARLPADKRWHVLRCGNVYGFSPALRIDAVVNKFMFQANFTNKIQVLGKGTQFRPFIHIDKLCQVVIALLKNDSIPSGTYDLFEHNYRIREIAQAVRELYPGLDVLQLHPDYRSRSLRLREPCHLMDSLDIAKGDLIRELHDFKSHFSF